MQQVGQNFYRPIVETINPPVNSLLYGIFGDPQQNQVDSMAMTVLKLVLILYASIIAPKLPVYVLEWFDYVPFKIFILFLIAWTGSHNPSLSLLIAITFYASLNALNGKQFFEKYTSTDSYVTHVPHVPHVPHAKRHQQHHAKVTHQPYVTGPNVTHQPY